MRRQVVNALLLTILVLGTALWIDFAPASFQQVTGRDVNTRLGLDLQGGSQIFLKPRDGTATAEQMQTALGVIDRRVNGIGVTEAVVQLAGENNIIVELPGVKNPEEATAQLKGAGNLEFIDPRGEYLAEGTPVCTTVTPRYPPEDIPAAVPSITSPEGTISGTNPLSPTAPITGPDGVITEPAAPITPTERPCTEPFTTIAKGIDLDTTLVGLTTDAAGMPAVGFEFGGESANNLATFTAQNIGRPMSIVLDNRVISSPQINGSLPGSGIITFGSGSSRSQQEAEARALLNQLKYGALPITLVEDSNRTIGATLGGDSVRASTIAGAIGMAMIMLFMLMYYGLPGLIADIALLIYAAIVFAIYKLIPVTLTLPGIAGFILSIGLAVDANVLIFARIKEELQRGRSLSRAIEDGYTHAWPSIRDSNASTLITSFILYFFGNSFGVSIIQGFALTLALGIIASLFTAITVSRMLLRMVVDFGVSDPRWFGVRPAEPVVTPEQV